MDYIFLVYYSADNGDGNISVPVAAYQYEESAIAYIEEERALDWHLAQYLFIEKVIFRV